MQDELDPMTGAVSDALVLMAEMLANPKPVTAELVQGWVLVLSAAGIEPHMVQRGVGRLLQTQTFFPTPADFIKAVSPPEDRAVAEELAWQRTLTCLRRFGGKASLTAEDFGGDGAALATVERIGFERLSRELGDDNRMIIRKEFVLAYQAVVKTGESVNYLPGVYERENIARGYAPTPMTSGRPDWKQFPSCRALPEPQKSLGSGELRGEIVSLAHVFQGAA